MSISAPVRSRRTAVELLLRHCLTLGGASRDQRPPSVRLEEAVGEELARRLLASIAVGSRR